MQKARGHPDKGLPPLASARFQVLFHSHPMGPFHLSLTVLVPYRSSGSIQPCGMVPAVSARIPRVPAYSGFRSLPLPLPVRAFHPLRSAFPGASRRFRLRSPRTLLPLPGLDREGLGFAPFARHYSGHRYFFLLLRVLRCFSSPRSPALYARPGPSDRGVPPFGHRRIFSRLPIPGAFRSFPRPSSPPEA